MSDEAKTIADIGKRNKVTMRFKQNLTEAEDDRATLLAIVKRQQDEIDGLSVVEQKYNAAADMWDPVYKIVLDERDALRGREAAMRESLQETAEALAVALRLITQETT